MNSPEIEFDDLPEHSESDLHPNPAQKWKALFFLLLLPAVLVYYYLLTIPFLENLTDLAPVVADSRTYMQFANDFPGLEGLVTLTLLNRNLLGPLTLLQILGNNRDAVLIFNIILFYFCLNIFLKSAKVNKTGFFLALVINPLMLSSLTSINKEVLSVCSLLVALAYTFNGRRRDLYISILLSLFVRQELTVLLIGYAVGRKAKSRSRRISLLIVALIGLSVLLPLYDNSSADILNANQTENSIGISVFLSDLTSKYMYFLAVIPRIILNLFGDIKLIFGGTGDEVYAYSAWSGLAFLIASIYARKRFQIQNDQFFLMACYAILFASPSFIHHRYFFPVYVVLLSIVFSYGNEQGDDIEGDLHLAELNSGPDSDILPAIKTS